MCRLLGVSKQAYYKHDDKLSYRLALDGAAWHIGFNHFYDMLERHGLKLRARKRRAVTTDSRHGLPLYPNLVKDLIPDSPCQLMVSDITYIICRTDPMTGEYTFCYLSLITDYYTKEIVGHSVGETLEARYPLEALEMALCHYEGKDLSTLIHHSDRGIQYASNDYTRRLKECGIRISMTESGNPKDNAVAERVNGTIKNELERPHWSLDGMTPSEASQCSGELKKIWTSYREKAIKRQRQSQISGLQTSG